MVGLQTETATGQRLRDVDRQTFKAERGRFQAWPEFRWLAHTAPNAQLDLENHGLKGRLELIEREGRRAEEQRTAAVADYEREVARHAEKLTALSDAR